MSNTLAFGLISAPATDRLCYAGQASRDKEHKTESRG